MFKNCFHNMWMYVPFSSFGLVISIFHLALQQSGLPIIFIYFTYLTPCDTILHCCQQFFVIFFLFPFIWEANSYSVINTEGISSRVAPNSRSKRRRVSANQTQKNGDLYINLEGSSNTVVITTFLYSLCI